MDRLNKAFGLALALSFIAVACAAPAIPASEEDGESQDNAATAKKPSTKKPPTAKPADGGTADPADPADPATPADPADPTPTPTPTPTNCSSSTTYEACFTCCDAPTGGALAKADATFGKCACEPGGQCATKCGANYCNGQQPSATCEACLTATCEPAADAQCTSAACKSGQQCLQASNCEAKP